MRLSLAGRRCQIMWMRMGFGGSFSWSTGFIFEADCLAWFAGRRFAGWFWEGVGPIIVRAARSEPACAAKIYRQGAESAPESWHIIAFRNGEMYGFVKLGPSRLP